MKKVIAAAMSAAMVASLTACGNASAPAAPAPAAPAKTEAAAKPADAPAAPAGDVWASGVTVNIDVPAKAGGGTDLYTRYMSQALGEVCPGTNFVVTNYDTGEVGMQHTKNADPDGLTVVTCHGGAIIQYMCGSSETNIKDDLKVVGILNQGGPQAIITNPGAPYTNFSELGEYIKANPGDVTVGCSLGGTTQILFTALVEALTGDASMVNYVQCASEADKLTNVASNAINIANCSIPNAQAYDADGKLTILGTLGPKAANVESMSKLLNLELDDKYKSTGEQGIDLTWDSNYYICVPANTPDEICEQINAHIMKASEQQSFIDGNNKMATFIAAIDYKGSQDALHAEWDFLDNLVGSMGLKVR